MRTLSFLLIASTCAAGRAAAQQHVDDASRHWTFSALGGVSSLALGGGGAAEVWSRVGPVRGGEGLLGAAGYGGGQWRVEAAYGQGHSSLAEFTASKLTLALTVQRQLGFVSTPRWETRVGVGFVRTAVSVPSIPFGRFQLAPSEIVGFPIQPFGESGDELLLANGLRAELSVERRSRGARASQRSHGGGPEWHARNDFRSHCPTARAVGAHDVGVRALRCGGATLSVWRSQRLWTHQTGADTHTHTGSGMLVAQERYHR